MACTGVHFEVNCIHILTYSYIQQLILSIPWLEDFTDTAEIFVGYNQNKILCLKLASYIVVAIWTIT